ncbi:MAG: hypothetical protein NT107_03690 [Planctomycetota bacterium]|nr:hypothetical protein [Planctomycetota bacterium]
MIAVLFTYLPLLLLTLAIELAIVFMLSPAPRRDPLRACVALNLCTHPLATLLCWYLPIESDGTFLLIELVIELVVFACEWLGYSRLLSHTPIKAMRLALLANIGSLLAGLVLWALPYN